MVVSLGKSKMILVRLLTKLILSAININGNHFH